MTWDAVDHLILKFYELKAHQNLPSYNNYQNHRHVKPIPRFSQAKAVVLVAHNLASAGLNAVRKLFIKKKFVRATLNATFF